MSQHREARDWSCGGHTAAAMARRQQHVRPAPTNSMKTVKERSQGLSDALYNETKIEADRPAEVAAQHGPFMRLNVLCVGLVDATWMF